jgi:hypothetical protein
MSLKQRIKSTSIYSLEEQQAIQQASPEGALQIVLQKAVVPPETIATALRACKVQPVEAFIARLDNKTAKITMANNSLTNRNPKPQNVGRLEIARKMGRYLLNGDAITIYNGLLVDGGNRLDMVSGMPDGESVLALVVLDPPITDIRHAILTSTAGNTKSFNDRFGRLHGGANESSMAVARHHYNLQNTTELSANNNADTIEQHYLTDPQGFNDATKLLFDAARLNLDGQEIRQNKFTDEAKSFGGKTRIEMLAAVYLILCQYAPTDEVENYVMAWISKSPYPSDHSTEIIRKYMIEAMQTPSKSTGKTDAQTLVRDERRPPILMRFIAEGFLWHKEYEETGQRHFRKAGPNWEGLKYDKRVDVWKVRFSVDRFTPIQRWLAERLDGPVPTKNDSAIQTPVLA